MKLEFPDNLRFEDIIRRLRHAGFEPDPRDPLSMVDVESTGCRSCGERPAVIRHKGELLCGPCYKVTLGEF